MEFLKITSPKTNFPYPTREYNTAEKSGVFHFFQKKFHNSYFKVQTPKYAGKYVTLYLANKYVPACLRMAGLQFSISKLGTNSFITILIIRIINCH